MIKRLLIIASVLVLVGCGSGTVVPKEVCLESAKTGRMLYNRTDGSYPELICVRSEYRCPSPLVVSQYEGDKSVYCKLNKDVK